MKKAAISFHSHIDRLEHLLGTHYVEVPAKIIQDLGGKFKVRLLCSINNTSPFQCGLVALGEGRAYITINNKRLKEFKIKKGDRVKVILQKDESEYGMEMPEELSVLLDQDKEGMSRFQQLSPGKQRYIIHYVSSVKNPQLRIDRSILLIENLKRLPLGKETFRGMLGLKD